MKQKLIAVLLVLMLCIPVGAAGYQITNDNGDAGVNVTQTVDSDSADSSTVLTDVSDEIQRSSSSTAHEHHAEFNEGTVLVKDASFAENKLGTLEYTSAEPLYLGSAWYVITLKDGIDTADSVDYLTSLDVFEDVDYDYVMGADGTIESIGVTENESYSSQKSYIESMYIDKGWLHLDDNDKSPGGSSDVIVAVIDTGVDYNHIDLRNNIWTNTAEIPGNGVDDDGNGYVDDVRGWDFVGNDADPMDDNGHGTHVAGIIAAENNKIGTVGVAYNCKVMVLKAGNSSGYFNNSAIAQAVQYAYMNGASVINMSFGGSSISVAVEDALTDAYTQCVLVAAAGNDGLCNNLEHWKEHDVGVCYPAALPYVIGVASVNKTGTAVSLFSNYDDTPYDSVEYEVYACGEYIVSTWPNNKVASLSGTSMAAPMVAGIAALLRSNYMDRDVYSNKYIQSQIVNTCTVHPYNSIAMLTDLYHGVANTIEALTHIPTPFVVLYDYYIIDSPTIDSINNGDGMIDSGETVYLAIELKNYGGSAKDVIAVIDTTRNNDPNITDPYVTIITNRVELSDIGTYSIRDGGKNYDDDGNLVSVDRCFKLKISDDCPNDYTLDINLRYSYMNNWDQSDFTEYFGLGVMTEITVSGYKLPEVITGDTVYTADKKYLVSQNVTIASGATVTFEEGCNIEFVNGKSREGYPCVDVYGELIFNGSEDKRIEISTDENWNYYAKISALNHSINYDSSKGGLIILAYCDIYDISLYDEGVYSIDDGVYHYLSSLDHCNYHTDCKSDGGNSCIKIGSFCNSIFQGNYYRSIYVSGSTINSVVVLDDNKSDQMYTDLYLYNDIIDSTIVVNDNNIGFVYFASDSKLENVIIMNSDDSDDISIHMEFLQGIKTTNVVKTGIYEQLKNIYNPDGSLRVNFITMDQLDTSNIWPFVKDVRFLNSVNEVVNILGKDQYTIELTLSREMNTEVPIKVQYGSCEPYAEFVVNGDYESATKWVGTIDLRKSLENGRQYLSIYGGECKDDSFKGLLETRGLWQFDIDTSKALSMAIIATETSDGVRLDWSQDDYETLMGYNVYRSTEKDGNYTKMNACIIPSEETYFIDANAEPAVNYWYTFTVLLSDMSESKPAGKISFALSDTISPTVYHTPVNQGYVDNNLVISCTASDNIQVVSSTLFYRTVGESEWSSIPMVQQNDRYSATIFGSELTTAGLQYYISTSDGINTITKGTSDNPYNVVIKDASTLSEKGDVDGDGSVTTKDALMIMQVIKGDLILSDDQFRRADLNSDDVLSSFEALRILQYIDGNVTTLKMV